jgi:hypothetical protein
MLNYLQVFFFSISFDFNLFSQDYGSFSSSVCSNSLNQGLISIPTEGTLILPSDTQITLDTVIEDEENWDGMN